MVRIVVEQAAAECGPDFGALAATPTMWRRTRRHGVSRSSSSALRPRRSPTSNGTTEDRGGRGAGACGRPNTRRSSGVTSDPCTASLGLMRRSLTALVPTRSAGCDSWTASPDSFRGGAIPSGFDPYRGCPAGLTPFPRPLWWRSRCRAAANVAGDRPRPSSPARPRWVILPDPIPFTSAEGRTVSMPCVSPAPARAPPGGEGILSSTPTVRGRASSPPRQYPRRGARLWRRRPIPRRRRSPSQPCRSITAPPAQCPSESVPGAVGIRADFTGPGTYGRRRVVPPLTPLPRLSLNGTPLGHLTFRETRERRILPWGGRVGSAVHQSSCPFREGPQMPAKRSPVSVEFSSRALIFPSAEGHRHRCTPLDHHTGASRHGSTPRLVQESRKRGNTILHTGFANDPGRREHGHQRDVDTAGHISRVGRGTIGARASALDDEQGQTGRPAVP